jgi:hypothetical protein
VGQWEAGKNLHLQQLKLVDESVTASTFGTMTCWPAPLPKIVVEITFVKYSN